MLETIVLTIAALKLYHENFDKIYDKLTQEEDAEEGANVDAE